MSFKDIKGQSEAISFLKGALESGRLSHAYIFVGSKGVGKRLVALNFAKALNCLSSSQDKPCDQCASCRKVDASNHPDVILLRPGKDGASIGIDDMRQIIKNIGMKPYESKKKIYIIDEADSMTTEAQNAFLKTLEEPPSDSILILVTKNVTGLLATIRSRAQVVRFFPLNIEEIKLILVKDYRMDKAKAHTLSHFSSGSIGQALKYEAEGFFEKRKNIIASLANNTFFNSDFEGLSKKDLKLYLDIILMWYRDVLISKSAFPGCVISLANIDESDAISNAAQRLRWEDVENAIRHIISTNYFLEQNANPRLAMSALGANLCMK